MNGHIKTVVFVLSFLCMASRHSCIESWSVIKPSLTDDIGLNSYWLGSIDTTFLFFYSIGLYISGVLEDGYSMKVVISIGLGLASLVYFFMILMVHIGIVSPWLFIVCWALQGLLQSTAWPGTVALIGNWFPKASHGGWMGFWSCNANMGNIIGAQVAILLMYYNKSWETVMTTVSIFMFIIAILTYIFVEDRPEGLSPTVRKGSINFWKALKLPGVLEYSCAYGCIKILVYSLIMWLPYYLTNYVHAPSTEKAILIVIFDLSGILASIVAGVVSDKVESRGIIVMFMLIIVMPVILLFKFGGPDTIWIYYLLIPISGGFLNACSNLITSCVATDLAHHTETLEHTHAMATVTGIIDGTGSMGAACGQFFIGWIQEYSWDYVFYFMVTIGCVGITILASNLIATQAKFSQLKHKLLSQDQETSYLLIDANKNY